MLELEPPSNIGSENLYSHQEPTFLLTRIQSHGCLFKENTFFTLLNNLQNPLLPITVLSTNLRIYKVQYVYLEIESIQLCLYLKRRFRLTVPLVQSLFETPFTIDCPFSPVLI